MRKIALIAFLLIHLNSYSLELFVYTEPASNMPAKSLGFRDMNGFFLEKDGKLNYYMSEIIWSINKEMMLHAQGFISNHQDGGFEIEGGSIYASAVSFVKTYLKSILGWRYMEV
jgi:hypothetical protein